jgi:HK97 family phage prohead protease
MSTPQRETRALTGGLTQLRADRSDGPILRGYAAVYNSPSLPIAGMFIEVIAPGTFLRALSRNPDVRHLIDHNPSLILGRTKSGTTKLAADTHGLHVKTAPPDTQVARDHVELIRRGDVDQMSFGFAVREEEWSDTEFEGKRLPLRMLHDVDLFDVSNVTYPAYPETEVGVRACQAYRARREPGRSIFILSKLLDLQEKLF